MMKRTAKTCILLLAAALLVSFCLTCTFKTKFWELKDKAPLRSISDPPAYVGANFGAIMAPVSVDTDIGSVHEELDGDYIAVIGTAPAEMIIYRFATRDDLEDGKLYLRHPSEFDDRFTSAEFGASVAAAPKWQFGGDTHLGCFAVGKPGLSQIEITDLTSYTYSHSIASIDEAGLSVDSVIITPDQPVEGFIVGGRASAVYLPADMTSEQVLDVTAPIASPDRVYSVTSGSLGVGFNPYLAFGADGRVFVFLYSSSTSEYLLEECIEYGAAGFGTNIISSDVNGDNADDLLISSRMDISGRYDEVAVISGQRYAHEHTSTPAACTDLDMINPPSDLMARLRCSNELTRSVYCDADPLFGSALAVGNLDGEDLPEIIIGAPGALVDGKSEAGAALIFNIDEAQPVSSLRVAQPSENQHLGMSLTTLNIAGRDEVFVGMPESDRILLFYCSGAGSDTSPPGNKFCR